MKFLWIRAMALVGAATLTFAPAGAPAAPSADIQIGHDPPLPVYFSGMSNPSGQAQVNVLDGVPGYLNDISGGENGGATGNVSVFDVDQEVMGAIEFAGVAIHVTDDSGASHSLSSLNDPALAGIVSDLNPASNGPGLAAYEFGNVPP